MSKHGLRPTAMLAGAIVKDVAYFAGTILGAFLSGADSILNRDRVEHDCELTYNLN